MSRYAIQSRARIFHAQDLGTYGKLFTLEEKSSTRITARFGDHERVAALAATNAIRKEFVAELWNTPVPDGAGRYYDGMLYFLGMLQVSRAANALKIF